MTVTAAMSAQATIPVDQAVGMVLPHDITEIVRDSFKGRAFKKGHIIREQDVDHLRRLGKEHIYVLRLGPDEIHENEAALQLAEALAGSGVGYAAEVVEGKVSLRAMAEGLLRVDREALFRFNLLGEVMCATLQDHTPVREGEVVAASRLIPLVGMRQLVAEAAAIGRAAGGLVRVLPLARVRAGLVITGTEVFSGRIEDRFEQVLRDKLTGLGSTVGPVRFAPDDPGLIAAAITECLAEGAELVVTSGACRWTRTMSPGWASPWPGPRTWSTARRCCPGPCSWSAASAPCRCSACPPAACSTASPCSTWCCPASSPARPSAGRNWPRSATAGCAAIVATASTRCAASARREGVPCCRALTCDGGTGMGGRRGCRGAGSL